MIKLGELRTTEDDIKRYYHSYPYAPINGVTTKALHIELSKPLDIVGVVDNSELTTFVITEEEEIKESLETLDKIFLND